MYPLPVYNGNTRARKMGPPRAFSFTQGNQPSLLFDAMGGTAVLGRGGQAPTFTRATVATITDQDLVVRQVLSGEARFGGFRRVQNLCGTTSRDFSNAAWAKSNHTITTGIDDPFGGTAAFRLTRTSAAASWAGLLNTIAGNMANRTFRVTIWIRRAVGSAAVNLGASDVTTLTSNTAVTAALSSTTWKLISVLPTGFVTNTGSISTGITLGADGDAVDIYGWRFTDVTGNSNQNPDEDVSVGVLSAPYQGANVDGVRYFPYLNGNTVASNVVTEATGAAISSSILGGYLPEPAATDLLNARADARDMTTANWTLGATMTRARTSTGADGVASKANRLTGGAVAATNIITTTITAAASSRTYSVLIKRVTGTGPVRITQDNFATSTDISSLINSSTFTLVQINQSQLNAVLGIKIDTNGDAIDADWNQFSAGDLTGLINSRIPDTISTRNADVLTYATTGWLNAAAGTLYAEWFNPNLSQVAVPASITNAGGAEVTNVYTQTITTAHAQTAVGGVTQADVSAVAITGAAVAKAVNVYQLNDFAGYANNTSLGTDAAGTLPTVTQLNIGHQVSTLFLGHYVRKVAYYNTRMVNESAKALTL